MGTSQTLSDKADRIHIVNRFGGKAAVDEADGSDAAEAPEEAPAGRRTKRVYRIEINEEEDVCGMPLPELLKTDDLKDVIRNFLTLKYRESRPCPLRLPMKCSRPPSRSQDQESMSGGPLAEVSREQ